jgi:hypothetical protein
MSMHWRNGPCSCEVEIGLRSVPKECVTEYDATLAPPVTFLPRYWYENVTNWFATVSSDNFTCRGCLVASLLGSLLHAKAIMCIIRRG